MKKTIKVVLAVLYVSAFFVRADVLVASFDIGNEARFNGVGPYAGASVEFAALNPDSALSATANGITLELANGTGSTTGIPSTEPTYPSALFGDFYAQDGEEDNQGNFKLTGLDVNLVYDIYIIAPNGTGNGDTSNVYGADYILGTGTADSTTVTATGGVYGDGDFTVTPWAWEEGQDYAVFSSAKADSSGELSGTFNRIDTQDHTGIAGIQVVAVPEAATISLVGLAGMLMLVGRRMSNK